MKSFLTKLSIFISLALLSFYIISLKANGATDAFYLRFTTSKQNSLILGTSRAAQGIRPDVMDEILSRKDIFNYSFTIAHSPYGPVYLSSIQRKLNPNARNGIFILAIDPWAISAEKKFPNETTKFPENDLCVAKVSLVNLNPNVQYLLNCYSNSLMYLFVRNKNQLLHDDGWLEIKKQISPKARQIAVSNKVNEYQKRAATNSISQKRVEYLLKTINFLKPHGTVYLVRIPISDEIMQIENRYMPDFNNIISTLSQEAQVGYFDLSITNKNLTFTDGNHLDRQSAAKFTKQLSMLISKNK